MATYTWRQGSTLPMYLSDVGGDFDGSEEVRAALKRKSGTDPSGEELLEFNVSYITPTDDVPAMWYVVGTPEQSLTIRPGQYFVDVRIGSANEVVISPKAVVRLVKTVTTDEA